MEHFQLLFDLTIHLPCHKPRPGIPRAEKSEGCQEVTWIWFPHSPLPHHLLEGSRGSRFTKFSQHLLGLESQKVNSTSQGRVPHHPSAHQVHALSFRPSEAALSGASCGHAYSWIELPTPGHAQLWVSPPPAGAMLRECPHYPWASSCFPGMLMQLKEQDHSNPMTLGDWKWLCQAHPWEAPGFWRYLSHRSFRVVAGRSPAGNHSVSVTCLELSYSMSSIHPFVLPFMRCLSHTPTHPLPSSFCRW